MNLLKSPDLKVVYNRLGTLKYTHSATPTLSVVVSSKHEKKAVARNKLRRRIYNLPLLKPITGIFYVSKQSYSFEYKDIKKLFYELLEKAA
jgi:ribonuclease P protein component